ncbi:MAG: hypothetical protein FWH36_06240 [Lentimicrobiaceae bacterium]|nr:hypothetical protein [Lentimicrobiaceae bacterium]MCL2132034.1 hypothetical protein [Lentimicrobiaceae bacterium]
MKYIFIIIFFIFPFAVWSQCPFGNGSRVECRYGCDNYTDKDGDGYCDYSRVLTEKTNDTAVAETAASPAPTRQKEKNRNPASSEVAQPMEESQKTSDTVFNNAETCEEKTSAIMETPVKKPYRLVLISALTLGGYFFTFLLSRLGILHKIYHRRIWNVLLLLTAAVSCLFGFFLVMQLNYGLFPDYYRSILTWHVECGIAMTIISVFHVIWHFSYYKRLFTPAKKEKKNATDKFFNRYIHKRKH